MNTSINFDESKLSEISPNLGNTIIILCAKQDVNTLTSNATIQANIHLPSEKGCYPV